MFSEVISSTCWQFHFEATGKFTGFMTGSTLDSPVPKRVRAEQIPYFFRSPYTTTALSDLHYPFNNQNAGYPKLYQNSKNSHELSSSIFLQMHTYHISLTHPLHLILSRLLQEIRRSISESASNSRLKPPPPSI